MSAIMCYRRITPELLAQLKQQPAMLEDWLLQAEESDEAHVRERGFDTDVTWHMLHYVLNGEAWGGTKPFWNAILGGNPIQSTDILREDRPGHFITDSALIWEARRYLTSHEVEEVYAALRDVTTDALRARFQISDLKKEDIYPIANWEVEDEEREFEALIIVFQALVKFFEKAALSGDAMLIWLG